MKTKSTKATLKHVCNQKEFIWGVRVSGLILGMTEYKVHYKEMSDMKRTAVVLGFLALYVLVGGLVYMVGCPKLS